ncbi:unnamed protein product, partial [marine sediment metagenome]
NEIKQYQVPAGTDIRDAIREGIQISRQIDCVVKFDFNGVDIRINRHSKASNIIQYYHDSLKEDK